MTVQRNQIQREMERGAVCTPPAVTPCHAKPCQAQRARSGLGVAGDLQDRSHPGQQVRPIARTPTHITSAHAP